MPAFVFLLVRAKVPSVSAHMKYIAHHLDQKYPTYWPGNQGYYFTAAFTAWARVALDAGIGHIVPEDLRAILGA